MTHNCKANLVDIGLWWAGANGWPSLVVSADINSSGLVNIDDMVLLYSCVYGHPSFDHPTCDSDSRYEQGESCGGAFRVNFSADPEEYVDRIDLAPFESAYVYAVAEGCPNMGAFELAFYGSANVVFENDAPPPKGGARDRSLVQIMDGFYPPLEGEPHTLWGIPFHVTDTEPAVIGLTDCPSTPEQGLQWAFIRLDDMRVRMMSLNWMEYGGVNADPPPDSTGCWVDEADEPPSDVPTATIECSPNPSMGEVHLNFSQIPPGDAIITVCDVSGRVVRRLHTGPIGAEAQLHWDGLSEQGEELPRGVYIVRLSAGGQVNGSRMIMLR